MLQPVFRRFEDERLDNGLRVLLAPVPHSPVVSTWVWYRVGSKNEVPGITGAAHWLEHMLFKGTPRFAPGEIDRRVLEAGGVLNAFTDADFTAYFTTLPREHLELPLQIEAERMTQATLPAEELDKERSVVLSERDMNENHPPFRVEEEIFALAFHQHPYRWDALGYPQDIQQMDREHLWDFYRRYYGPANAVLVVAGGFDPATVGPVIETHFGPLPRSGEDPRVRVEEPPQRGPRTSTLTGPGSTPLVRIGWRVPPVEDPQSGLFLLLDLYLGGEAALYPVGPSWHRPSEHPSARLYQALVDTGLAVRALSDWRPRVHSSLFSLWAQAAPGRGISELEDALLREVRLLRERRIPSSELRRLKEKLVRGANLGWEGSGRSAFRLGLFSALGDPSLDHRILQDALRATPRDLQRAASELFCEESQNTVRYLVSDSLRSKSRRRRPPRRRKRG